MMDLDGAERATVVAALQHYLDDGLGDPSARSDHIHHLATDGDQQISLDDEGVEQLLGLMRRGGVESKSVPALDDKAGWDHLALQRGWGDAEFAHARGSVAENALYQGETVVELPGGLALHAPANPARCDYVRVVDKTVGAGVEIMYWSSDELRHDPDAVLGALVGLLKKHQPELSVQMQQLRTPPIAYERTASLEEMACHIASLAEGEPIVDPEVAQRCVGERYSKLVWQHEVRAGETELGYWEWALHEARQELEAIREPSDRRQRQG